jgi:catechol 2,3-dioxygenase-like lactoylglutathione lyase family enzyme
VIQLNHLALRVSNVALVRDWYRSVLDLEIEFDTDSGVGMKDDSDFTLILTTNDGQPSLCSLYFEVENVASAHTEMVARGVTFLYGPQPNAWGYGAGLLDPDGRLVGLWDQESMAKDMAGTND